MREDDLRGGIQTTSTIFDWPIVIKVGPGPRQVSDWGGQGMTQGLTSSAPSVLKRDSFCRRPRVWGVRQRYTVEFDGGVYSQEMKPQVLQASISFTASCTRAYSTHTWE